MARALDPSVPARHQPNIGTVLGQPQVEQRRTDPIMDRYDTGRARRSRRSDSSVGSEKPWNGASGNWASSRTYRNNILSQITID